MSLDRLLLAVCLAPVVLSCASSQVAPTFVDPIALSTLDDVCPQPSSDAVCVELRAAEAASGDSAAQAYRRALRALGERVRSQPLARALRDPVLRWAFRERWLALLVRRALAANGPLPSDPNEYASAADAVLAKRFQKYDGGRFRLARTSLAAEPACDSSSPRAGVVFFPGVVRVDTHDEFETTMNELTKDLPCLEAIRAETATFVAPATNALRGCEALDQLHGPDRLPPGSALHMVGYSQGGRNAAQTLVTCPEKAPGMRSVLGIDSALHGSPVADAVALSVSPQDEGCMLGIQRWVNPLCWFRTNTLALAASALAPSDRSLSDLFERENVGPESRAADVSSARVNGIRSLSTYESRAFYATRAHELPDDVLYVSFRSAILDTETNLPCSNRAFFDLIARAGGNESPWNDMQVRLVDQRFGPPLDGLEVVSPAGEGNHWQWALEPNQVPDSLMPDEMFENVPRAELVIAHFETLGELGLLTRADPDPGSR